MSLFLRQIFALFYDSLLLLSLFLIASLILLIFTQGKPIPPQNLYYQLCLFGIIFAFFVGFWSFGGQTTGMRAWRIKITPTPSLPRASLRFFLAIITVGCGGLGWLWILLDPERLTLYDRLAGTRVSSLACRTGIGSGRQARLDP